MELKVIENNLEKTTDEVKVFSNENFGDVRTVVKDGEPWFVAVDMCRALDISNHKDAIKRLDDDEKSGVDLTDPHGRVQFTKIINEPGLYSLILRSRKPEAKKFKRWITHEVIPSIRKYGGYIDGQEEMSDIELLSKALLIAKRQIEERDKLIEEMEPAQIFTDAVSASENSIHVGDLAKLAKQNGVDTGQQRLFEWLRDNKFLIKRKGSDWNMPTQQSMERELFEIKETVFENSEGRTFTHRTPLVTGKGQVYFINKLLKESI